MQRPQVLTETALTPRCRSSMMRALYWLSVSQPVKDLKLSLYHAKVLGVTFLRYWRSCMKSAAVPLKVAVSS